MSDAPPAVPVLRITRFDRAIAGVIVGFAAVCLLSLGVTSLWVTTQVPEQKPIVPIEMLELPGGFDDGSPDETLRVDSPDPEDALASPAEEMSQDLEIAATVDAVVDLSESGSAPATTQFEVGVENRGRKGSASGTGRRALGFGPGKAGFPREQRWMVRFGDRISVDEYAKQLEFFKLELGALLPDGRLALLSRPTQAKPTLRYLEKGAGEKRLFMTWQAGERRQADTELFAKVGVTVNEQTPLMHFYAPETEEQLARLEREYRNRPPEKVKRTYYAVEPAGPGRYKFVVLRQQALN